MQIIHQCILFCHGVIKLRNDAYPNPFLSQKFPYYLTEDDRKFVKIKCFAQ